MGFSTGLLAAAAVALSPAVSTLIPLAVEIILIAFRIGLHIERTARNVQNSSASTGASWSFVIPGSTEAKAEVALATFHSEKVVQVTLNQKDAD